MVQVIMIMPCNGVRWFTFNIYVTGGDDGNSFVAKFDNDGALQWTRKIFAMVTVKVTS